MYRSRQRRKAADDEVHKIRRLFHSQEKPLNAYLITSYDQHNNNVHVAKHDRRLEFLANFSGEQANAVITETEALIWVDGRKYDKSSSEIVEPFRVMITGAAGVMSESEWLVKSLPTGSVIGACGRYVPATVWLSLEAKLALHDMLLVDVDEDLVEMTWTDRPQLPHSPALPYPLSCSGKPANRKINNIRFDMAQKGIDLVVVTELDDIAWVLNLRGRDMKYTPVFYSFLVIGVAEVHIFVDELSQEVSRQLYSESVRLCQYNYDQFYRSLQEMAFCSGYRRVFISDKANYHVYKAVPVSKVIIQKSLIAIHKSVKNDEEAHGMIEAHVYDGYALCKFFSWLSNAMKKKSMAPTELTSLEMLEQIKTQNSDYLGPSFPTVSASGVHSSIYRYRPTNSTNRVIAANDIYVCESGSQYLRGTTSVKRTYCFGKPTNYQRECYTRVLKGLINLGSAVFPLKTKGSLLDALPRLPLWRMGLDYDHGTGHGIGAYLSSVEGPIGFNRRRTDDFGLLPNMFLTNEPSYYKENSFGIRLGNVEHVIITNTPHSDDIFLTFENITLVPYQVSLLIPSQLTPREIDIINSYHMKVRNILGPVYKSEHSVEELNWLLKMTEPLVH